MSKRTTVFKSWWNKSRVKMNNTVTRNIIHQVVGGEMKDFNRYTVAYLQTGSQRMHCLFC